MGHGPFVDLFDSDRLGRRRGWIVAMQILMSATLLLCMPIDPRLPDRPVPADVIIVAFWAANIVYAIFQGLMYGTRTALFMDICTPAVAATQFTAYMAMLNLVIWYSATWQGFCIEAWGYPITLGMDALAGLACLPLLPLMSRDRDT